MELKNKICIPLDVDTKEEALELIHKLKDHVGMFKVGLQLFTREGPQLVKEIKKHSKVFLDLKFHDIPNTVTQAVKSVESLNVDIINVHAQGGLEMMQEANKVKGSAKLIAVTKLTSQNATQEEVLDLAKLAKQAGLDGVVASAQEAKIIRQILGKDFLIVTPGIRPKQLGDDQVRTATPKEAIENGSDLLVVGRPIIKANDPVLAAKTLFD